MRWNLQLCLIFLCAGPVTYGLLALFNPSKLAVFGCLFGIPLAMVAGKGLRSMARLLFS